MASHEFRTPLTSIQAASEILEHYDGRLSVEQRLERLRGIQVEVDRMTHLLNEVLTIGKADSGKMAFEPRELDLEQLCRRLAEEAQASSAVDGRAARGIEMNIEGYGGLRMFDERLLRHVMSNLLSNALKYSPSGLPVEVTLIWQQNSVKIRVRDRGIGIPLEDQDHLFEPFHRGKNVGEIQGTGLGLAIVKRSVDLHLGRIEVESVPSHGTTFLVELPAPAAPDPSVQVVQAGE